MIGLISVVCTEDDEEWLNSLYILEVQPTGFSDDLVYVVFLKQKEEPRLWI